MMRIPLDSYGFLKCIEPVKVTGFLGQVVICHFDMNNYRPELLAYYNIQLPQALKTAAKKRLAEYVAGRIAARQALQQLGCNHGAVGRADDGRPLWPVSVIGSISHHSNRACCAVAFDACHTVLGIDIEHYMSAELALSSQALILQPKEQLFVQHLTRPEQNKQSMLTLEQAVSLFFSAKESLYKALYPGVLTYFDFLDASLRELNNSNGYFSIGLDVDLNNDYKKESTYHGFFYLQENDVLTLVFQ